MSAPDQAPAEAPSAPFTQADSAAPGAGPAAAPDRAQLRAEYQKLGKEMQCWLLGGAALLLALPLLWWWLPAERRLAPTPTPGYRWRQAGTVQDSGTTWVWALADSAGQTRLLLSRTHGRTWLTRNLGVPAAQARALALGWGSSWRGVLLGQKGELRLLPDVWRAPQQGEALMSPAATAVALAVDTQGQRILLKGGYIWQSSDAGKSWVTWRPDSAGMIDLGNHLVMDAAVQLLFEPTRQRFFVVSRFGILQQVRANGSAWKLLPNVPRAADSVLYAGAAEQGSLLVVYHDGSAIQLSSVGKATEQVLNKFRAFTDLPQSPAALVGLPDAPQSDSAATAVWPTLLPDSALLFGAATDGGFIRRFRLRAQALVPSQPPAQPTAVASTTKPKTSAPPRQSPVQQKLRSQPQRQRPKPSPSQSPVQQQPASNPATTPSQSPVQQPASNPAATPNQSPVQQTPVAPRSAGKKDSSSRKY